MKLTNFQDVTIRRIGKQVTGWYHLAVSISIRNYPCVAIDVGYGTLMLPEEWVAKKSPESLLFAVAHESAHCTVFPRNRVIQAAYTQLARDLGLRVPEFGVNLLGDSFVNSYNLENLPWKDHFEVGLHEFYKDGGHSPLWRWHSRVQLRRADELRKKPTTPFANARWEAAYGALFDELLTVKQRFVRVIELMREEINAEDKPIPQHGGTLPGPTAGDLREAIGVSRTGAFEQTKHEGRRVLLDTAEAIGLDVFMLWDRSGRVSVQQSSQGTDDLEKWRVGDRVEDIAIAASIRSSGAFIPGVTTLKWGGMTTTEEDRGRPCIYIALDRSGSMAACFDFACVLSWAVGFWAKRRLVPIGLYVFDSHCRELLAPGLDYQGMKGALEQVTFGGGTCLSSALSRVVDHAAKHGRRPTVIVVTDAETEDPGDYLDRILKMNGRLLICSVRGARPAWCTEPRAFYIRVDEISKVNDVLNRLR